MRNYRGLTKDGKWVYGWYCHVENKHFIIYDEAVIEDPHSFNEAISGFAEVLPETVGQYTGLKDKNGKEVYGKDKLKDANGDIGIVYWKTNVAGFYCKWGDGSNMPLNTGVAVNKCEIIGTNPELLEQE